MLHWSIFESKQTSVVDVKAFGGLDWTSQIVGVSQINKLSQSNGIAVPGHLEKLLHEYLVHMSLLQAIQVVVRMTWGLLFERARQIGIRLCVGSLVNVEFGALGHRRVLFAAIVHYQFGGVIKRGCWCSFFVHFFLVTRPRMKKTTLGQGDFLALEKLGQFDNFCWQNSLEVKKTICQPTHRHAHNKKETLS